MNGVLNRCMVGAFALGMIGWDAPTQPRHASREYAFPLVDEAPQDADFDHFRSTFVAALKQHNVQILRATMDDSLRQRMVVWLEPVAIDWLAATVQDVLALGGRFTRYRGAVSGRREFCAPYVYSAFPNSLPLWLEGEATPWAIIGERATLRAQRSSDSAAITTLSPQLVRALGWLDADNMGRHWAKVTDGDRRSGYVVQGEIRDPLDYHACFAKIDEQWKMTELRRDMYPPNDRDLQGGETRPR